MNKRLLILNGIAILAVIANHATLSGYIAMFWWTDRYWDVTVPNYDQMGSLGYFLLVAVQKLTLFSVPAFLFVTGAFLTYMARGQARLTFGVVWRRVLNLLPPYLIWTIVYFIAQFALGNVFPPLNYLVSIVWVDASPYFFVPLVIVYYLLSPVLVPLAKNHWKILLFVSGLVLALEIAQSYLILANFGHEDDPTSIINFLPPQLQVLEFFFYYTLGIVAGFYQQQLKILLTRFKWVLLGMVIIFGILAVVESEWVYQSTDSIFWRARTLTLPTVVYALSFILCFMAFDQVELPFSNQLFKLGGSSLGIYLVHKLPLLFAPKIIYHLLPGVLAYQVLYQPILISLAVLTPLILMELTRRSPIRSLYRTIFG